MFRFIVENEVSSFPVKGRERASKCGIEQAGLNDNKLVLFSFLFNSNLRYKFARPLNWQQEDSLMKMKNPG